MLNKKTFHKKWYCLVIQVLFWVAFIFLILLGIFGVLYEDDMPFIGFFWAGVLAVAYWLAKRLLYYVLFRER